MKIIKGYEITELLEKENHFTNTKFELDDVLEINTSSLKKITFKNCVFTGADIFFTGRNEKATAYLSFMDCSFYNQQIYFHNCDIDNIYFSSTYIKNDLYFVDVKLNFLSIINKCKIKKISINGVVINRRFSINRKNIFETLSLFNSEFNGKVTILNTTFQQVDFSNSTFKEDLTVNRNTIKSSFDITNNNFNTLNFENNTFNAEGENFRLNLLKTNFNGITYFSKISAIDVDLYIRDCNFKEFVRFNGSIFKFLHIEQSNFLNVSSFQDTKFKFVYIDRTNFDKISFFDDISIENIDKCDKRTLRNIKQQLQKSNNKIDFDVFKAFELNSYKNELKKENKFWYNNKDAFILSLGSFYSNNGMNWYKALLITIFGSFIFYLSFYLLFFWINVNDFIITKISLDEIGEFLNGFSKFLIPTNIYNPLLDKEFVVGLPWFPFIIGKIFLSIGIYEIIKSFRKYRN